MNDRGNHTQGRKILSSKDRSSTKRSRLFRFSFFSLSLPLSLFLVATILEGCARFVVFRRCCWRKVESTWGRVASMAPTANGRAALQTLISCRFRGPSRFYLSESKSVPQDLSPSASGSSVAADTLLVLSSPRERFAWSCSFDEVRYLKSLGLCFCCLSSALIFSSRANCVPFNPSCRVREREHESRKFLRGVVEIYYNISLFNLSDYR